MGFSWVLGGFSVVLDPPKNHPIFPSFPLKGLRRPGPSKELLLKDLLLKEKFLLWKEESADPWSLRKGYPAC